MANGKISDGSQDDFCLVAFSHMP